MLQTILGTDGNGKKGSKHSNKMNRSVELPDQVNLDKIDELPSPERKHTEFSAIMSVSGEDDSSQGKSAHVVRNQRNFGASVVSES